MPSGIGLDTTLMGVLYIWILGLQQYIPIAGLWML